MHEAISWVSNIYQFTTHSTSAIAIVTPWILTTYPTSAMIAGTLMHEAISWILTTHPTSAIVIVTP